MRIALMAAALAMTGIGGCVLPPTGEESWQAPQAPVVYHTSKIGQLLPASWSEWTDYEVRVVEEPSVPGAMAGDGLSLIVTHGSEEIDRLPFVSAYGVFHLDVVDLTGDGAAEYVLRRGERAGPGGRRDILAVYELAGSLLMPLLGKQVSGYFADGLEWRYEVDYIPHGGIIELHLKLTVPEVPAGVSADRELVPKDDFLFYRWDKEAERFAEVPL